MPKPLRSTEVTQRQDVQFRDFGVLNDGKQGKGAVLTSIFVNGLLILLAIIIGLAVKKPFGPEKKDVMLVDPSLAKPPEPVKPPPPPKLPPPPRITPPKLVVEPPKIKLPDVPIIKPPEPIKVEMPKPTPPMTPAPPKVQVAAAAPKPTTVNLGHAASVANNDAHPAVVALGQTTNPLKFTSATGPSAVNLGNRGMPGMAPGTGGGPHATSVNFGSGQPNGSLSGGAPRAVAGVQLGVKGNPPGGTGNSNGTQPSQVALYHPPPPLGGNTPHVEATRPASHPPQVLFKPKPQYTSEATAAHIEGNVSLKIHVASNGAVSVVAVTSGLGHGLDESARRAILGTRFKPATDLSGNPVDWDGTVNVSFQLAS